MMTYKKTRGFTLIELLVVVLIIGILAAVAVPQYRKAVAKSRYATLKNLTEGIIQAQEVFYMANGSYATSFEELDIDMPAGTIAHEYDEEKEEDVEAKKKREYYYVWGMCAFNNAAALCRDATVNMEYRHEFPHAASLPNMRSCAVRDTQDSTDYRAQICQAETGGIPTPNARYNLVRYAYQKN